MQIARRLREHQTKLPVNWKLWARNCQIGSVDLRLCYTFNQPEPTFQSARVTPVKPPPASAVETSELFFAPTQLTDRPVQMQKHSSDRPQSDDQPTSTEKLSSNPVPRQVPSMSGTGVAQQPSDSDVDTESNTNSLPHVTSQTEEGKLSDLEQDISGPVRGTNLQGDYMQHTILHGLD